MEQIVTAAARRDFKRLDRDVADRILRAVMLLAETGQGDILALQGRHQGKYRLRVGDWRVLFERGGADLPLRVLRVLPRGEAYR